MERVVERVLVLVAGVALGGLGTQLAQGGGAGAPAESSADGGSAGVRLSPEPVVEPAPAARAVAPTGSAERAGQPPAARASDPAPANGSARRSAPAARGAGLPAQARQLEEVVFERDQARGELRAARLETARLESTRAQLVQRIRELTTKRTRTAEMRPDGRVIELDLGLGTASIDRGWNHGLARHTRFAVYRRVAGGALRTLAILEVQEVGAERSFCRLIACETMDPSSGEVIRVPREETPPRVGDLLHNPFYDPRGVRSCLILGERSRSEQVTREQLAARIEALGWKLQDEPSVETDFVLVLERPRDAASQARFELAQTLGAVFLGERAALEYLGLVPYPISELR